MSKRSRQRNRALERSNGLENKIAEPAPLSAAPVLDAPALEAEQNAVRSVGEIVERATANAQAESKQPRFTSNGDVRSLWNSVYRWTKLPALTDEPTAKSSPRAWDTWMRDFFPLEPYLAGVLNSVVQIDKNRHWTLTGGRNQVLRYTPVLNFADNGAGWRAYDSWQAQSYYLTRMGFVTEEGRDGDGGPLRALWSVDPCACELTGNPASPLKYFPANGGHYDLRPQEWMPEDFFRAASLVSTDERQRGYGLPAAARAYALALIMVAIWEHDKEKLAARAPRGLLLLLGISEEQWETAMQARTERLDGLEREYFAGVATLASTGVDSIDAKLVALSSLPEDFDLQKWTSLLMYGYALAFGYDAREFFPVDSGSLGSAKETEVQHRKASSKGDLDFSLAHQEQIQNQLPPTLLFEYEQRDVAGEIADVQAQQAKAELITEIRKWGLTTQLPEERIMQLAAQAGIIPQEWTEVEEDVSATDTDDTTLERIRSLASVQRAAALFPHEPIVQYEYPSMKTRVLFRSGEDVTRPRVWTPNTERRMQSTADTPQHTADAAVLRSLGIAFRVMRSVADVADEYERTLSRFVQNTFDGELSATDLARAHRALVRTLGERAFDEGLQAGGVEPSERDEEDDAVLADWVSEQLAHVREFADAAVKADDETKRGAIRSRVALWTDSVRAVGGLGKLSAQKNKMLTFDGKDGDASCADCRRMKGKRMRAKTWLRKGLVPRPGNDNYECGNFQCAHYLRDDDGERFTGE